MTFREHVIQTLMTDPIEHLMAHHRARRNADAEGRDGCTEATSMVAPDQPKVAMVRREGNGLTWLAVFAGATWAGAVIFALTLFF